MMLCIVNELHTCTLREKVCVCGYTGVYSICISENGYLSNFFSCRDTAGQERFRTITTAYYRGAMVSQFLCVQLTHPSNHYPMRMFINNEMNLTLMCMRVHAYVCGWVRMCVCVHVQ